MTTYIIITERRIHHEGDERSRTHPGHGYGEYTETVNQATEYTDYDKFETEIKYLEKSKSKYKAFTAEQVTVTTTVTMIITK